MKSSDKWSKLKMVKMESGQNGKWSKWKVVKMKSGQNEKWSKQKVMTSGQHEKWSTGKVVKMLGTPRNNGNHDGAKGGPPLFPGHH